MRRDEKRKAKTPSPLRKLGPVALIFGVALAVYIYTLCPTIFIEGAGENAICALTLSVPHPPGFPLFCLLGKLFSLLLPLGEGAFRINLFAATMGAAAVAVLFLLLRSASLAIPAAAGGALLFAFSATFWRQATIAEVYTLSMLLMLIELALLLRWRDRLRGGQTSVCPRLPEADRFPRDRLKPILPLVALVWGLGMTVHYMHVLLLPAYGYFLLAHDRELLKRWRTLLGMAGMAVAGLSLHLYAPLRSLANPVIDWGNPETLANWWRYLTAEQYRGRMFHMPREEVLANLALFLRGLPQELGWLALIAAVGGALVLAGRDRRLFGMTAIIFLVGTLWAINYDLPWEINVYYLPALLMTALWAAFGLHWLGERFRRVPFAAVLGALLLPALALAGNFRDNDLSDQSFVRDIGLDALAMAAPPSHLLLPSTNPTFAAIYLTRVEQQGAGVHLWSRAGSAIISVEQGVQPAEQAEAELDGRFVSARLAKGEAVYTVDRLPRSHLPGIAQIPWGCLYRFVPNSEKAAWLKRAPDPLTTPLRFDVARPQFRYGSEPRLMASRYLLVQGDYAWETGQLEAVEACYRQALVVGGELLSVQLGVGKRYEDQGKLKRAETVYRDGLARKDNAGLHNRLGVVLAKQGALNKAEEEFRRAIALDPQLGEAHLNLASVYGRRGDIALAISELEQAYALTPNDLMTVRNLGFAYAQSGQQEKAQQMGERARALQGEPTKQN